jgi:hypothetical protein
MGGAKEPRSLPPPLASYREGVQCKWNFRVKFHLPVMGSEWEVAGLRTLAAVPTYSPEAWCMSGSVARYQIPYPQEIGG